MPEPDAGGRPATSPQGPGLRSRPFVLLATGQAVSRLGDGLFATALVWIALALVPAVVPARQLLRANGIMQACFMASFGIGPLLLGPLLAVTGMPGVAAADAATFAVSAATLGAIRLVPARVPPACSGMRRDLAAGWRAVRSAPDVLLVLGTFVAALVVASGFLAVGLPAWVSRAHGGPGTLGLLQGAAGISELAGALALARLRLRRLAAMAVAAWAVLGGFRLFLGATDRLAAGLPLMAGTGLASAATDIPVMALLQTRIPGQHLGKAMALWYTGIAAATTISPPLAALAIRAWGLTASFALSGSALVLLSGASLLRITRRQPAADPSPTRKGGLS